MTSLAIDPFSSGVLRKDVHSRLVADIDNVARDASIMRDWIWAPLQPQVGPTELAYVRKFKEHRAKRCGGLCYVGRKPGKAIDDRMSAIAGALVRNFVRARVMTLEQLLSHVEDKGMPDFSALMVPNFFIEKSLGGGKVADWKVGQLLDTLTARRQAGLQTILYVSDLESLGTEYGVAFERLIKEHYIIVNAN